MLDNRYCIESTAEHEWCGLQEFELPYCDMCEELRSDVDLISCKNEDPEKVAGEIGRQKRSRHSELSALTWAPDYRIDTLSYAVLTPSTGI